MNAPVSPPPINMAAALEPTADPAWVIGQHGFDPLRDSSRQSRFSISNGFLGVRGGRAAKAGLAPRTYVARLFDVRGAEQPIPALVPVCQTTRHRWRS